jgi:hypothetical protein
MAEITDRRRALAAAVVLARCEVLLGLPDDLSVGTKERCDRILTSARHGGLGARAYRLAWLVARGRGGW